MNYEELKTNIITEQIKTARKINLNCIRIDKYGSNTFSYGNYGSINITIDDYRNHGCTVVIKNEDHYEIPL